MFTQYGFKVTAEMNEDHPDENKQGVIYSEPARGREVATIACIWQKDRQCWKKTFIVKKMEVSRYAPIEGLIGMGKLEAS